MRLEEHLVNLENELKNVKWDVLGISETRLSGEAVTIMKSGHMLLQRNSDINLHISGVALLIHKKIKHLVTKTKAILDRVIYVVLRLNNKCSMQIIQAYAPTSTSTDEDIEQFYEDLTAAKIAEKTKFTIITGDFNAKIGSRTPADPPYIGAFVLGMRNPRKQAMMDFLSKEKIYCLNTFFKKHPKRKWTWRSPDNTIKNEIDYVLATDKRICADVSTLNRFDTGSDYRLVRAKILVDTRLERKRLLDKKKRGNPKLSPDTERQIEERRRTNRDSPRYKELNKAVRKAIKKDKRAYNTRAIKEAIENNMNMRVLRSKLSKGKVVIYKMKNDLGEVVTERDRIAEIIENFYRRLYSQSAPNPNQQGRPRQTILNVGSEDLPAIDKSELEAALKQLRNNRAPGEDRITVEMLKVGGEKLEKALLVLLNRYLEEGKVPDS
ncbi:craniofacial development protein 2-like [Temnothorax nylanderi]|uniref:craniofacial development protein 2-like n=1 Tax=Temnothorax nylanderi TaxID=102681 RepID=UPI003A896AD4